MVDRVFGAREVNITHVLSGRGWHAGAGGGGALREPNQLNYFTCPIRSVAPFLPIRGREAKGTQGVVGVVRDDDGHGVGGRSFHT